MRLKCKKPFGGQHSESSLLDCRYNRLREDYMLETIQLRVRLVGLTEDADRAHQMLDAFEIPRSSNAGSALSVTERLEFLREQLANAELRQAAVLEAARAYRVS